MSDGLGHSLFFISPRGDKLVGPNIAPSFEGAEIIPAVTERNLPLFPLSGGALSFDRTKEAATRAVLAAWLTATPSTGLRHPSFNHCRI